VILIDLFNEIENVGSGVVGKLENVYISFFVSNSQQFIII